MRKLTKIERLELRRQLVSKVVRGYPVTAVAEALAASKLFKGRISKQAIRRDWHRRDKWLPFFTRLDDLEKFFREIMIELRETRIECWHLYERCMKNHNESAAVSALKLINDSCRDTITLLQSLGKLEKAPTKIDALITTPDTMPFEKIPEIREAMDRIQKRLRAEKLERDKNVPK